MGADYKNARVEPMILAATFRDENPSAGPIGRCYLQEEKKLQRRL